jgi:hypothetical protein
VWKYARENGCEWDAGVSNVAAQRTFGDLEVFAREWMPVGGGDREFCSGKWKVGVLEIHG